MESLPFVQRASGVVASADQGSFSRGLWMMLIMSAGATSGETWMFFCATRALARTDWWMNATVLLVSR